MARYVDAIDLALPIEEAFDLLADFSHTAEWDPSVIEAERLTEDPLGPGSRFRVAVSFLGRRADLEYEIITYERPSRLVLRGGNDTIVSIDEITFVPREQGTRLTYEARVELTGLARIADPLLDVLFARVGRVAVRGLREHVSRTLTRRGRRGGSRKPARGATKSRRRRA